MNSLTFENLLSFESPADISFGISVDIKFLNPDEFVPDRDRMLRDAMTPRLEIFLYTALLHQLTKALTDDGLLRFDCDTGTNG